EVAGFGFAITRISLYMQQQKKQQQKKTYKQQQKKTVSQNWAKTMEAESNETKQRAIYIIELIRSKSGHVGLDSTSTNGNDVQGREEQSSRTDTRTHTTKCYKQDWESAC